MVYKIHQPAPHMRFGASYGRAGVANPRGDFHTPFGLVAPGQFFSLIFRRHMHLYGTKPTALAEVAVAQRYHATRNPRALMQMPLTIETTRTRASSPTPSACTTTARRRRRAWSSS